MVSKNNFLKERSLHSIPLILHTTLVLFLMNISAPPCNYPVQTATTRLVTGTRLLF